MSKHAQNEPAPAALSRRDDEVSLCSDPGMVLRAEVPLGAMPSRVRDADPLCEASVWGRAETRLGAIPVAMHADLTRREFLGRSSVALGVTALASGAGVWSALRGAQPAGLASANAPLSALSEVLSFHLDQPYIDVTGAAQPYIPPRGARSAQVLAEWSAEQLRTLYFCI